MVNSLLIKIGSYAALVLTILALLLWIGHLNNKIDSLNNARQLQNNAVIAMKQDFEKQSRAAQEAQAKKDADFQAQFKAIMARKAPKDTTCEAAIDYAKEEAMRLSHAIQY